MAIQFKPGGEPHRPDAGVLSYVEGLLRALAETTENEMDQGRWTRRLDTYDGPATYRLCIPASARAARRTAGRAASPLARPESDGARHAGDGTVHGWRGVRRH